MRYDRRNANMGGSLALPHTSCVPGKSLTAACDLTKVTTAVLDTAAAATALITMQLNRCNFFWTCSTRFWFIDNAAASTNRRAQINQIEVNACAQECGSAAALAAAAVDIVGLSDDYTQEICWWGIPVCWSPWSRNTFAEVATAGIENIDAAAIDSYWTHWGVACPALPPGLACGRPPGELGFQ